MFGFDIQLNMLRLLIIYRQPIQSKVYLPQIDLAAWVCPVLLFTRDAPWALFSPAKEAWFKDWETSHFYSAKVIFLIEPSVLRTDFDFIFWISSLSAFLYRDSYTCR